MCAPFFGYSSFGPTARMSGFARIGATRPGRHGVGQSVRPAVDGDRGTAAASQTIERVFGDVPFDTGTVRPAIDADGREAAAASGLLFDECGRNGAVSRVGLAGPEIE